jgi:hypothetical protein
MRCSLRRRRSRMVCWPITPAGSVSMPSGRVPPLRSWISENPRNGHCWQRWSSPPVSNKNLSVAHLTGESSPRRITSLEPRGYGVY